MKWQDFDLEGRVKVPIGYYLLLIYLLRGYVTWIFSLTYAQDRSLILSLVYPQHKLFITSLLLGIPAVIAFVLFTLKSQTAKPWFQFIWSKMRWFLAFAVVCDLAMQGWFFYRHPLQIHWSQLVSFIIGIYLLWYWSQSKSIRRFFTNWLN